MDLRQVIKLILSTISLPPSLPSSPITVKVTVYEWQNIIHQLVSLQSSHRVYSSWSIQDSFPVSIFLCGLLSLSRLRMWISHFITKEIGYPLISHLVTFRPRTCIKPELQRLSIELPIHRSLFTYSPILCLLSVEWISDTKLGVISTPRCQILTSWKLY